VLELLEPGRAAGDHDEATLCPSATESEASWCRVGQNSEA
jgi:hypothetical protein